MAGYSLQQLLGYVTLTGLIQATKSGIPNTLPPKIMKGTRQVLGDSGRYTQVTGERRVTHWVDYGSPAVAVNLRNIATRDIKLMHTFEQQNMDPLTLQQIRQYESYEVQRMGAQEVARQVKEFGVKFQNFRTTITYQVLSTGTIYVDSSNNILPTSSGAAYTFDFGMDANNQNQLNGIITASWALSNTNIPLQLVNLQKRAAQLTGYPLKYAVYGANIPTYFTNNDYVVDYLSRQPTMSVEWLDNPGVIPQGLFGFIWVPAYTAFFEGVDGTNNALWGDDKVVFMPEISTEWWDVLEGSYTVPTTINLQNDATQAMNSLKLVYGMFSYAQVSHNPPGVATYMGDTFVPCLKVPNAIYQGDVTP